MPEPAATKADRTENYAYHPILNFLAYFYISVIILETCHLNIDKAIRKK